MKLTYFSEQTLPKTGPGGPKNGFPKVAFSKVGTITFNKRASALMELKAGDKVIISRDEEAPENWYVHKDKQHGFELRGAYNEAGCMFNHRRLVEKICEATQRDPDVSHSFKIAGQPTIMKSDKAQVKYWGILII